MTGGSDGAGAVHAYAACGRTGDVRKALALLSGPSSDPIQEHDRAFQWLEKAFEHRDFFLTEIKTHKFFDPLRSDPRFKKLLERMKFPS